jgi:hypothetical protein
MTKPTHRRKLNPGQLEVLRLLHAFRFITNDLLAQYLGKKDRSFVFRRLKTLQDRGLIGKRFQPSYRLQGKPAAYYLTPEGSRLLQGQKPDKPVSIQAIYKDKSVSELFIDNCLSIFAIHCHLKARYGDNLRFFAKSQLANRYDYFSEFTPGAYMGITFNGEEHDFFLEYLQSSKPFFAVIKRLKEYAEYADSGEWEAGTDSDFPAILLVCDNQRLQNRLMKSSELALSEAADDLKFYVTTRAKLDTWQNLADQDEIISLDAI